MAVETHIPASVSGRREEPGPATRRLFRGFLLEHAALVVATAPLEPDHAASVPAPYRRALEAAELGAGLDAALGSGWRERLPAMLVELADRADMLAYVEVRHVDPLTDTSIVEALLDAGMGDASRFADGDLAEDPHEWLVLHVPLAGTDPPGLPFLIGFRLLDAPLSLDARHLDFVDRTRTGRRWRALLTEAATLAEAVNRADEGAEREAAWERFIAHTAERPEFRKLKLPPALEALYRSTPFLSIGPVLFPALELPGLAPLPWSPRRRNPGRFVSFWYDPPDRFYLDVRDPAFTVYRRPLEGGTVLTSTGLGFDAWLTLSLERLSAGLPLAEPWLPDAPIGIPLSELSPEALRKEPLWGFDPGFFTSEAAREVHPDADERWVRPYASNYTGDGEGDLFFTRAVLTAADGATYEAMAGFRFPTSGDGDGDSDSDDDEAEDEAAVEVEGFTLFDEPERCHFGLGEEGEAVFLADHDLDRLRVEGLLPLRYEVSCGPDVLARGEIHETLVFDPGEGEGEGGGESDGAAG